MASVDYKALAPRIVDKIGGEANINQMTHCATRLRFKLKDDSLADKAAVEQLPGGEVSQDDALATLHAAAARRRDACELSRGRSLGEAVQFASAMAAISVQRLGVQASNPSRARVDAWLDRLVDTRKRE